MTLRRFALAVGAVILLAGAGGLFLGYPCGRVLHAPAMRSAAPLQGAVILLSGDGGAHTGMAPAVAANLRAQGVPVVLASTLAYFSHARSDGEIAGLLRQAMALAAKTYGARRFVMIGQSFGADVLPTGLARLPSAERAKVAGAILVVPSRTMERRATPFGLLNTAAPGIDSLPALNRLDWLPLACIHGAAERSDDSACPVVRLPGALVKTLPGGHYLRHDDVAVTAALRPIIAADLTKLSSADHAGTSLSGAQGKRI